jgi:BirA family biotin operon repressor/biotin-[acetyl-CoA-carboxylase] ligase
MEAAARGDPGRLWLVAEAQTGGKGRRGRSWASPPGNLYASLLLIDPAPVERIAQLGFVAGAALAQALAAIGIGRAAFGIKWPNDLVQGRAKFSGLLLEARQLSGRLATVIGCGVNCGSHPDGLPYPTTDLSAVAGRPVTPAELFAPLAAAMADMLDVWERGAGFERIRAIWLGFAAGLGEIVRVDTGGRTCEGIFEGIDAQGRLVLRTPEAMVTVDAGDVLLGRGGTCDAAG